MARVKGGPHGHLRHKRVLAYTKGQFGSRHRLIKRANEARLKSMWYATATAKYASVICAACGSPVSMLAPARTVSVTAS